ncbi:MAG TPA: isoprenylcysteine carboxylmethyltransferase family protein [Candidatus Methylomirabilis sp.]|nr:isoprenylcysteine carboxylmethyltransferase family protein [Candidatus Methylomirabilis sp.]
MHGENVPYGYAFWSLVVFNVAFFVIFTLSFLTPLRRREWRAFGVYSAFIVALFTEMYGFPLTIYILTALLGSSYPALNPFSHASGHLWVAFFGGGAAMMTAIHIVSNALMFGGLIIISLGWSQVHRAQGGLVTSGTYTWVRHPQYSGLFLITIGLLIQWPTIVTALTWPILFVMYVRLARREEGEMARQFGEVWQEYSVRVPRFVPRLRSSRTHDGLPVPGKLLNEPGLQAMQPEVPGADRLAP